MKPIPWERKPIYFFCPRCGWVSDAEVSNDQVHEIARGGCGNFVLSRADALRESGKIDQKGNPDQCG